MTSNKRVPTLTIPDMRSDSITSSDEESPNDIIKNMHIKFGNARSEQIIAHPKDLEYYNKLFECKRKLAEKNIIFYIGDKDLIELANDKSETLYLKITKGSGEQTYGNQSPINNKGSPRNVLDDDNQKSPKRKSRHSPRHEARSRSNSTKEKDVSKIKKIHKKNILSLSDGDTPKTSPKTHPKMILMNIEHDIYYNNTNDTFSVFKIENINNVLHFTGISDTQITQLGFVSKYAKIAHNEIEYNVFTQKMDSFLSPMIVSILSTDTNTTNTTKNIQHDISTFVNIFPQIVDKIINT